MPHGPGHFRHTSAPDSAHRSQKILRRQRNLCHPNPCGAALYFCVRFYQMKQALFAISLMAWCAFCATAQQPAPPNPQAAAQTIQLDLRAPSQPFPHFWEQMFGSGRAILSLRENYRQDLRETEKITGFRYGRFHAIFHDEVGVYDENEQGQPVYNFSYVDQIYAGLLADGVRPFVELSFMPKKLASKEIIQSFWYRPNVAPPKDWNKWDDLVTRYGIDEVAQ